MRQGQGGAARKIQVVERGRFRKAVSSMGNRAVMQDGVEECVCGTSKCVYVCTGIEGESTVTHERTREARRAPSGFGCERQRRRGAQQGRPEWKMREDGGDDQLAEQSCTRSTRVKS
eukprot:6198659-Pleurochrysis_carterae.AAC.2